MTLEPVGRTGAHFIGINSSQNTMINTTRLLKVSVAWTSIAYTVCYVTVWLLPGVRDLFLTTALHAIVPVTSGPFTIGTYVIGLIVWDLLAVVGVWLFVYLWNTIKD